MARKHLWYGLIATVGMGATSISSAVVGDPIPVVIPAVIAFGSIAGHHVKERDTDTDEATDADVEQAVAGADQEGRRDDRRGDRRADVGEQGDPLAADGGRDDRGDDPLGMYDGEDR